MRISDATSISDHIDKAVREDCYIAQDIPLPVEITESLDILINNRNSDLSKHWAGQLSDLQTLTNECEWIHRIWDAMAPESIRPATGNLKTVTLAHLAGSLNLGGGKWIRQFTYGFPLIWNLSQSGVYPRDDSLTPAPSVAGIWENAPSRSPERAKQAGNANAGTLWEEAFEQVRNGWLGAPSQSTHSVMSQPTRKARPIYLFGTEWRRVEN